MKFSFKFLEKVKNQAGATAIIVAITLPMLIGFGALAVDVGYMYVTKNELQNVADAAALAATRQLGTIYQGMTYDAQKTYVCGDGVGDSNNDISVIKGVANAVAYNNKAGGEHIIVFDNTEGIDINHVEIGVWDLSNTPAFTATFDQPDAVRVTAHRDNAANGPITTFFAKIFGIDNVDVSADATAALTSQSIAQPGELVIPIGISSLAIDECNDPILFSPTADSCAGWTSFTSGSNDLNVDKIITGDIISPALTIGDEVNFIGGQLSDGTFNELLLLFKDMGYDVYVDYDDDGNEILPPVATDAEGNPVTGHLDPSKIAQLIADPNVTVNAPVVPLWLTDVDGNLILDADNEKIRLWYPESGPPYKDEIERNRHLWPTTVLVYREPDDATECGNPNQSMIIDGFATILFTDVIGPPHHVVIGELLCDQYSDNDTRGGGGGGNNSKGTIPNLVE
jgi:Flp pilus assembly protein TadG